MLGNGGASLSLFLRLSISLPLPPPLGAMSAWSVKTGRVPSQHCKDARVYGQATTAMHTT